ncbi:MAG: Hsp20/alpha crystallin family protein [bacterium]|nr:Hsp20/alpha crystallin family protein [bacterium]
MKTDNTSREEQEDQPIFEKISVQETSSFAEPEETTATWLEAEGELVIDVYQTDKEIVIQTAIAGVKAEDLDISIENDVVSISGERKHPNPKEATQYHCQECYWGAFSRQVILSEEVDHDKAKTSMKDGVLIIRLPRLDRQKTHKIEIEELE